VTDQFFASHSDDQSEALHRLDESRDVAVFARNLADVIEGASTFTTLPVEVVNGNELVFHAEGGDYRVAVERIG
jgi:hypothetical protein